MIANAELARIVKATFTVEADVALKEDSSEAHFSGFFQRIVQQCFAVAFTFQLWCDSDRPHSKNRYYSAVIRLNYCFHEHILADQTSVFFHDEIQFRNKRRIIPEYMDHIMFAASRAVNIPE